MNKTIPTSLVAGAVIGLLAACAPSTTNNQTNQASVKHNSKPKVKVPPAPHPDGTYSGSCDYTLSNSLSESNAGTLVGEVDLVNTGNVTTHVKVRITWPQEGFAPIAMTRVVKTRPGQHLAVRFHTTASQSVISQLQSWQDGHGLNNGCTYKATILGR